MSRNTLTTLAVIVVAAAAANSALAGGCGGKKYYGGASNLHHRYISSHNHGVYRTHHKPVVVHKEVIVEKPVIVERPVVVQQPVAVPTAPVVGAPQPGFAGGLPQGQPGFPGAQPQGQPGFPQGQPGMPQGQFGPQQQGQQPPMNNGQQPRQPQLNIRQAQQLTPTFAAGSQLVLDGQRFGGTPGRVMLAVGPMEVPVAVANWTPSEVTIQLPELPLTKTADARVVIIDSEGNLITQSEIKMAPKASRLAMGS